MSIIVGTDLAKTWSKTPVFSGVSFAVEPGVTGLLGSNGAGKTTLLGMILGLHRPDRGTLRVLDLDPAHAGPEIRARLGYSPEHHTLPPDVKASDLVRHIAELHGIPSRAAATRSSDALWQVGLGEERFRPIGTMSTGQRQRVKLAQAIAHDPALVLLDEPTDGLDPVQRDDMLELIRRCGTEFGISVLLSSHLLEEVERICDAAVILGGGELVASGSLDALRGDSQGLIVEVDRDPDRVVALLVAAGLTVQADGMRLFVDSSDARVFDLVRDAVVEADVGLRRLQTRRISLEDVFLSVSGGV